MISPLTIQSLNESVQMALKLKNKGKNVIVLYDLDGTIMHGREGDPVWVRKLIDGIRAGEFEPYKDSWYSHYEKCEPLKSYKAGILPQDLVNQHVCDEDILILMDSLHQASIPVIGATGRSPLSDVQIGYLTKTPDWLSKAAETEKPTDTAAAYKKKALATLCETVPDELFHDQMLICAVNRSNRIQELSGVFFSGQEFLFLFGENNYFANGIAYMGYDKRTGILNLIDALVQNGFLEDPKYKSLDVVFVDDDARTMSCFTEKPMQDYLDRGLTMHLMHYPWSF